jgi:hypothetical protein
MNRRQIFASDYDALGPTLPEATVNLVDALRDYIEAEKQTSEELSSVGEITAAECKELKTHLKPFVQILQELEKWQVDQTLNNFLPWRPK